LFFIVVPLLSEAQTSIDGDAFPVTGDTFLVSTDRLPYQIILGPSGAAKTWDFTTLQAPYAQRSLVLPYENRSNYKELDAAEAVLTGFSDYESYIIFQENSISEVGRRVPNPLQEGETLDAFFNTPKPMYESLKFDDKKSAEYQLIAPFPTERFSYAEGNEWARQLTDVRIHWKIQVEKHVDAWGLLRIPFERHQALREKVIEKIIPTIETKNRKGAWINARKEGINCPILKAQTNEYYIYWSNEVNRPPAIVFVTPGTTQIQKIHYNAFEFGSRIISEPPRGSDVIAYPNPAFDFVRFDFLNLPSGDYIVDIYNILGVRLQSFDVTVDGYTTSEFDLSDLKKGTYIYRVTNEKKRTITSKRLIIIQP
jgi:hypothetical protein